MPSLINPYENQNSFTTAIYVENGLAKLVNGRPLKAVSHYWRVRIAEYQFTLNRY